jgi:hypothetical protein
VRLPASMLGVALCLTRLAMFPAESRAVPSASNSQVPAFVRVVGTLAGVPDTAGTFVVVVRDFANNPVHDAQLTIDFSACTDLRLCPDPIPGETVSCTARTIQAITNVSGIASVIVVGAGTNTGGAPGAGLGAVRVLANGLLLKYVTANILDEDGAVTVPGVDATDLAAWIRDYGVGTYVGRSDFNQDGHLGGADLSTWLVYYGRGASHDGCGTAYCP